jgi:signal peptidase II
MQMLNSLFCDIRSLTFRGLIKNPLTYLGALVVLGDQLTKSLLTSHLAVHEGRVIIPGFLNLVHARNTGAAFSLLAGSNTAWRQALLVGVSVLAVGVITYLLSRTPKAEIWSRRGLVLILAGALGNLIDRMRFGEVVDFLDFYQGSLHWPAFNVADSSITVGAGILLVTLLSVKPNRS